MNTHSFNLDKYKMEGLSYIRDDKGRLFKAKAFELPRGGGHHRFGRLRFPGTDSEGAPFVGKEARYIEVIIKEIGGIKERVLRWELPVKIGL